MFQFLTSTEAPDFSTGLWSSTENTAQECAPYLTMNTIMKSWHWMGALPALAVLLPLQPFPECQTLPGWHCLPCRTTGSECPEPQQFSPNELQNETAAQITRVLTVPLLQVQVRPFPELPLRLSLLLTAHVSSLTLTLHASTGITTALHGFH